MNKLMKELLRELELKYPKLGTPISKKNDENGEEIYIDFFDGFDGFVFDDKLYIVAIVYSSKSIKTYACLLNVLVDLNMNVSFRVVDEYIEYVHVLEMIDKPFMFLLSQYLVDFILDYDDDGNPIIELCDASGKKRKIALVDCEIVDMNVYIEAYDVLDSEMKYILEAEKTDSQNVILNICHYGSEVVMDYSSQIREKNIERLCDSYSPEDINRMLYMCEEDIRHLKSKLKNGE